jgi:hypothetical protein
MAADSLLAPKYSVESTVRLTDSLRADLDVLADWLFARAPEFGLTIDRVHVSGWRSLEVPQNRETIVDVWVNGEADAALRLWSAAGAKLGEIPSASGTHARAPLAVDVHWQ